MAFVKNCYKVQSFKAATAALAVADEGLSRRGRLLLAVGLADLKHWDTSPVLQEGFS